MSFDMAVDRAVFEVSDIAGNACSSFSARILPRLKETPLPEPFSKAHPYVLFNTLKSARNFSQEEIIKALEKLQETDRVLKTTGVTPSFLLEDFIFFLCRQPKIKNLWL